MIPLKTVRLRLSLAFVLAVLLLTATAGWAAQPNAAGSAEARSCAALQQNGFPQASISNGQVQAVVYLPDAQHGYYRGARFDWSGVVGCLAYKGHTYFGVWYPHYDPLLHDAITGPVEEFRSADGESAPGYDEAKPGELFLKPGVGMLRRIDEAPFRFSAPYPLADPGRWTVRAGPRGISFRQEIKSPSGFGYVYTKKLRLDRRAPVLRLEHALKNTGTKTIETEVYDHDFYRLDGAATGPDMVVRFPFAVKAEKDLGGGARIDGKEIVYDRELEAGQSAAAALTGYSGSPADYDFIVENQKTGAGVEQTSDAPIARMFFWSIRTTICPEAYIHLRIAPGQTARWTIRYRFYAR
jgi:hypothetical protein